MLFERVAHGRKGIAVAEARDGLCTLCHVRLRPQKFNEVRRNDGLHQCDSCTRILYFVPRRRPAARPALLIPGDRRVHRRWRPRQPGPRRVWRAHRSARRHGARRVARRHWRRHQQRRRYNGLLAALQWAVDHGQPRLRIRADSELLVKQMRGEYKVKNPGLKPLYVRARLLVMSLDEVVFEHVRRELNEEADRLSNLGMDAAEAALRGR